MTPQPEPDEKRYIIMESHVKVLEETRYGLKWMTRLIRSHPIPPAPENTEQCHTCKHEGSRACMLHGYDEVPGSCEYKLGTHAEEAMQNLNGTFIDCWTKEHDAQVAKTERARLLDVITDWLDGNEDAFAWIDDTFHRRRFVSGLGELQHLLDSLRRKEKEATG